MNVMEQTLNIFNYNNFLTFLLDHSIKKKSCNKNWSYGLWARQLGLGSTATLSRILSGQRRPGKEIQEKLISYFKFSTKEKRYFSHLILLEKVKDNSELQVLIMEKLKEIHPKKKFSLLNHAEFSAISNWHFFVLKEMVGLSTFREDPTWIAKKLRFSVSEKEIKRALEILQELELIERDTSGKLRQKNTNFETSNDIASEASKRNHEQNLDLAKKAIRNIDLNEREFNSVCLNIKVSDLPEIKKMIRHFKEQFVEKFEYLESGDLTSLLQLNFFPYTKVITSEQTNVEN